MNIETHKEKRLTSSLTTTPSTTKHPVMNTTTKTTKDDKSSHPFRCYICNAEFPSKDEFQVHARTADHSTSRAVVLHLPPTITNETFLEISQKHEPGVTQAWVKKYKKAIGRGKWGIPGKRGHVIQMTIGYVIFQDDVTRDKFVNSFDGKEIEGRKVVAESIIKGPTIVVTGISDETDEKTTEKHFSDFKPIKTSIKLFHGRRSARITFSNIKDRDEALEKCNNILDGKEVKIKPWKSRFELKDIAIKRRSEEKESKKSSSSSSSSAAAGTPPSSSSKKILKADKQKNKKSKKKISTAGAATTPKKNIIVREEKPKSFPVELTNLPDEVDEGNIGQIFAGYKIVEKKLEMSKHAAVVHFETEEIAKEAVVSINEIEVNGKTIVARYLKPKRCFTIEKINPDSAAAAAAASLTDEKANEEEAEEEEEEAEAEEEVKEEEGDEEEKEKDDKKVATKKKFKAHAGNLDYSINSSQLKGLFLTFNCKYAHVFTERGRSIGFGVVTFETAEDMQSAIESMNGKTISGRVINLSPYDNSKKQQNKYKKSVAVEDGNKLHISLFPIDTVEKDVEQYLSDFNPVSIEIQNAKKTKYATVEFANEKDMNGALEFVENNLFKSSLKLKVSREKVKN